MNNDSEKYSPREKEIAHLLEKGFSKKMIAAELGISVNTVRTLVARMYLKAHVRSVTQFLYHMHLRPELF
jgi:DNA-binding NarL/FixJ family response regulator